MIQSMKLIRSLFQLVTVLKDTGNLPIYKVKFFIKFKDVYKMIQQISNASFCCNVNRNYKLQIKELTYTYHKYHHRAMTITGQL